MKIKDILARKELSVSFEFFPPKTSDGEDQLLETVHKLKSFNPKYISVTYGAGGSTREGTRRIVKRIVEETGITTMPHLTCVGSTKEDIRAILEDYAGLGIENILALRGDLPEGMTEIPPESGGFRYASDLVGYISSLKQFSIGVAVYPEGHIQAKSLEEDIKYTKMKVDAGADFGITQMFFDNSYMYDFMDRAGKAGINIPIICGIMPVAQLEKIKKFCGMCKTTIPKALEDVMCKADCPEAEMERGMDYVTEQVQDLMKNGFKYFHIYTLNRADVVTTLFNNLGIKG
ncbi:MAG: methylenetetrahydrofolate reductase [NAD(P)H] [Deltaproteobacteria bacterium]